MTPEHQRMADNLKKTFEHIELAGGFAFSIHIIPRATTGIDFVIFTDNPLNKIEQSLKKKFCDIKNTTSP